MRIDHIGYAVKDMRKARQALQELGYALGETVADTERQVSICFGEKDGYRVELIAPLGEDSPVTELLARSGPTPYHLCYESDAFDADLERLQAGRYRLVLPPREAIALGGRRVAFLMHLSVGLIEVVEARRA